MKIEQKIDGNDNIQAAGDVNITNINNYKPSAKIFYPQDIKSVIEGLSVCFGNMCPDSPSGTDTYEFEYVEKEKKNKINSLSEEYFQHIQDEHLMYFSKVEAFLSDPKNRSVLEQYNKTARMFRYRIACIRNRFNSFDEIIGTICTEMFECREELLIGKEEVCIILVNFMYWNCDIGKKVE